MRSSRRVFAGMFVTAVAVVASCFSSAQEPEKLEIPDYLKVAIPDAIDRGRAFLRKSQTNTGTWAKAGEGNVVGLASLPALTLLECGVAASDPGIQAAARFVRASVPSDKLTNTYEVSLALLFLDRLGDKKDAKYIETLAARLIAAQTPTGGWGYQTQYLNETDSKTILASVRGLEPLPLNHLLAGRVPNMYNPFVKKEPVPESELTVKRTFKLKKGYEALPCFTQFGFYPLVDPDAETSKNRAPFLQSTDNSTTQFALLALWAARRHGIPCTRTGAMTFMRFHTSQNADGSWGYPYKFGGEGGTPTMINCGLLGMAVGHGIVRELKLQDDPPVDEDPRILNGFKALTAHVGEPQDKIDGIPLPNLYFIWGLERVCMLYNVHKVGTKDWYRWGAEALLANQDRENGNWDKGGYPGATPIIDTSFALMFLRRANLAEDLSSYLTFSPKKLNEGVIKLAPPPPPKVVETKPEPPKVVVAPPETKSEPKKTEPVQVAEAKGPPQPVSMPQMPQGQPQPTPPAASGGSSIWIWIVLGVGVVLIVGGLLLFFLLRGGGSEDEEEYDEDENDRPRRKKSGKGEKRRRSR